MPVKIDPLIVEELAALDLVIWEAKHPKQPFFNEKTGKHSSREDKSWVIVSLAGPGVDEIHAGRRTLREAVDAAIVHSSVVQQVPGLRGAMLRLERAMWDARSTLAEQRYDRDRAEFDDDDSIPF